MQVTLTPKELTHTLLWGARQRIDSMDPNDVAEILQEDYGPISQESWGGSLILTGDGTKLTADTLGDALRLDGTLGGYSEDLNIETLGNRVRSRGTHLGNHQELSVDTFGDDLVVQGINWGHKEDLRIDNFGGDVTIRGTHLGNPISLSFDEFAGDTTVRGQVNGHEVDLLLKGPQNADRLVMKYLSPK